MTVFMADSGEFEKAEEAIKRIDDYWIDEGNGCYETWSGIIEYCKYLEKRCKELEKDIET